MHASPDLSVICDAAATQAAKATGVPISVLKAISLTETGRKREGAFRPWPWTVNMEGKGVWFETEDEARAYVYDHFKQGARSFDVGCFQINYKWHGENFTSIDQMFEPGPNALYAAEFLKGLFAETGSWEKAAGAYHSRTPSFAERYQKRFAGFRARFAQEDGEVLADVEIPDPLSEAGEAGVAELAGADPALITLPRKPRINTYPLLQSGQQGALGSLVSLSAASGRSLISIDVAVE